METDHDERARELESQGDDMETRRDELERDTAAARQDLDDKVADQSVPGVQDEQEDVLEGRKAVEEREGDGGSDEDEDDAAKADAEEDEREEK